MDARPQLERIARALRDVGLECILIGNAAAALRGAPVTTLDSTSGFATPSKNRRKLVQLAKTLGTSVLRPYYLASSMFRLTAVAEVRGGNTIGARSGRRERRSRASSSCARGGYVDVDMTCFREIVGTLVKVTR
jgi:hypothetical protein